MWGKVLEGRWQGFDISYNHVWWLPPRLGTQDISSQNFSQKSSILIKVFMLGRRDRCLMVIDHSLGHGFDHSVWLRTSFKYSSVRFQPKLKSLFHFFMSASTIFDVQGHVINWFDVMVKVMAERRKESFQLYSTFLFVKFSSHWKFHPISFKIFRLV